MKETNLMSGPRLLGRCCFTEFLYSKVTFMLLIFMFPLFGMAQAKMSQQKLEALKKNNPEAYTQMIVGNTSNADDDRALFVKALSQGDEQIMEKIKTLELEGFSRAEIENYIKLGKSSSSANRAADPVDTTIAGGSDLCADATPISCGESILGNNLGATGTGGVDCGAGVGSYGVWFTINGDGQTYTATTTVGVPTGGMDTVINVYSGSCGSFTCVGSNDDFGSGLQSQVSWSSVSGTTYYIYVTGYSSAQGTFNLSITGCTPPSDGLSCGAAISIGCGDTDTGTTAGSTAVGPTFGCGSGLNTGALGIWYKFEGSGYPTTIDLSGSLYDTELFLYSGTCGALTCLTGDDDGGTDVDSKITDWPTTEGVTYYLWLTGFGTTSNGSYVINVTCTEPEPYTPNENSPNNDICEQSTPINCFSGAVLGDTTFAQAWEQPTTCGGLSITSPGIWYSFEGDGSYVYLDTNGSSFDTKLHVFTGSCGVANLVCFDGDDDGGDGLQSALEFESVDGETYFILVSGFSSNVGNVVLNISCITNQAPDNDLCSGATEVFCGDYLEGSTQFATADMAGIADCDDEYDGFDAIYAAPGVWYSFYSIDDQIVILDLSDSDYDTKLGVFTGSCGSLVCFDGDDDGGEGLRSQLIFNATAGTTYYIYVTGYGSTASGSYALSVECIQPPENDLCADATEVFCGSNLFGNTTVATDDNPYTDCGGFSSTGPGVWHTFVGTGAEVTMSLCGSDFDTKINVYTGICGALDCVGYNDDGPSGFCNDGTSFDSQITLDTVEGEVYYLYISGFSGATGNYEINIDCACVADAGECATVYSGYDVASNTTVLTGTSVIGVEPVSYEWSTGGNVIGNTQSISVTPSEPTVYTMIATDATGCSFTDQVFVNVLDVSCDSGNSGNYDKVVVCHSNGNGNTFNLCVAPDAVASHLAHGDILGGCGLDRDCTSTAINCDAVMLSPANGEIDVPYSGTTISWSAATYLVTGYTISIGTTSGGTNIANNVDVGNALSYNPGGLPVLTTIYVTITPYNSDGIARDCTEYSFTTIDAQPDGLSCATALPVGCGSSFPASTVGVAASTDGTGGCTMSNRGLWFTFVGDGLSTTITTDADGSYDQEMSISYGSCGSLTNVTCRDSGFGGGIETYTFNTVADRVYYIYVAHWSGSSTTTGTFTISRTCAGARAGSNINDVATNGTIDWSMAPNPTRGNVTLDLGNYLRNNVTVEVIDFTGKVISTQSVRDLKDARYNLELNSSLPSGMYFVRVATDSQVSSKKLVIMR